MKKQNQEKFSFVFKAGPGIYGKGHKQVTEDDFIQLRTNSNAPAIPSRISFGIYQIKTQPTYNYNQILNLLFGMCIVILFVFKFLIDHLFITQHEKNLEDLVTKLCFAFIGSYIFYNVVTKTSDKLKKESAYAVICGLIDSVVLNGIAVKEWILIGAGKDKTINIESLSKEDFKALCQNVNIEIVPQNYDANIGNLILDSGVKKINALKDTIFSYMPFLESELLHLLNRIHNSKFSMYIIYIPYKKSSDLKEFSLEIFEFFELIERLKTYNDKLKRKYLKNNYEKRYN